MTNVLMVIPPSNFREEELFEPKKIFEENGFSVTIASIHTRRAIGMSDTQVKVDKDIGELPIAALSKNYEAVVFVGGSGIEENKIYENQKILELARAAAKCRSLSAICLAPMILANAGILQGKQATVFATAAQYLRNKGADYTVQPVVEDGNVITASGPAHARRFADMIVDKIKD